MDGVKAAGGCWKWIATEHGKSKHERMIIRNESGRVGEYMGSG